MSSQKGSSDITGKVVVVAVKASKEISRTALVWALNHVAQPGDCIKMLVVIPAICSNTKIWGLPKLATDCVTSHWISRSGTVSDQREVSVNSCSQMVLQLHDFYDPEKHKAPVFGNPPIWFTFSELQHATCGFSQANFLAEGGFGSVHHGVLPNGQVIAVKQYKVASTQGDKDFCSEVEVLSCAQHRNVVMLIGFCVENGRRLLVYEYICNGSLYSHLHGQKQNVLEWSARKKIAVGTARGLRYLHEECRVGCIVHRDLRPKNILLTHDFEALVGDFGLARWQPDGEMGVQSRVIGTLGYLAPEYTLSGEITEKADVYSFGVVLLELITGRKAMDVNRPKGQQCLHEWVLRMLEG